MNFKKIYLVQGVIYINNIYINYIIFNWIKSVTYWNSRTGHLTPTVTSSGATGRTGGGWDFNLLMRASDISPPTRLPK